jgi:hypothetical protein
MPSRDDLERMVAEHEANLGMLKRMLSTLEEPVPDRPNPLFSRTVGQQPASPMMPRSVVPGRVEPPSPQPPQQPPAQMPVPASFQQMLAVEKWREILFRPSMASAMLYVIMPVIDRLVEVTSQLVAGDSSWSQFAELVEELRTWQNLTIAQRTALEELFVWVTSQLDSQTSVIPFTILSNMAAATADYSPES